MSNPAAGAEASFAREFLGHYLKNGMGSMSKTDIDALVMHLLDRYGDEGGRPLGDYPNQVASERLRAPLSRVKRLRYEAALKYGGRPEDEARRRFALNLARAGLEFDRKGGTVTRIVFVVEDVLARNWIQGQVKAHSGVADSSFNAEIVKVEPALFLSLLRGLLDAQDVDAFEARYQALVARGRRADIVAGFKELVASLAKDAARAGGALVAGALLPLPAP